MVLVLSAIIYERANEEKNGGGILLGPVGTGF
jgi:hypothetical protein